MKTPQIFKKFGGWIQRNSGPFKDDFKKELRSTIIKSMVGALLAVIVFVLGIDKITNTYQEWKLKKETPARTVYYQGHVTEAVGSKEIAVKGAVIKVKGIEGVAAQSDEEGYYLFSREEHAGEHSHVFIVSKEGYQVENYPEIPSRAIEGDTTTQDMILKKLYPDSSYYGAFVD